MAFLENAPAVVAMVRGIGTDIGFANAVVTGIAIGKGACLFAFGTLLDAQRHKDFAGRDDHEVRSTTILDNMMKDLLIGGG